MPRFPGKFNFGIVYFVLSSSRIMRSYFIFDIKQIDFAWVYLYVVLFNFSVVSSTALWEVCVVVLFFAKGIKAFQIGIISIKNYQTVCSKSEFANWRVASARLSCLRYPQINFSRFPHWCLNPVPGHTVQKTS
jgi:hypothetical protein